MRNFPVILTEIFGMILKRIKNFFYFQISFMRRIRPRQPNTHTHLPVSRGFARIIAKHTSPEILSQPLFAWDFFCLHEMQSITSAVCGQLLAGFLPSYRRHARAANLPKINITKINIKMAMMMCAIRFRIQSKHSLGEAFSATRGNWAPNRHPPKVDN